MKHFLLLLFFAASLTLASKSQTINTVAGDGIGGYNGDNMPATSAEIYTPYQIVVDSAGNLYIADYNNMRVRKVTPAGTITTVAGTGTGGYTGDGGLATNATLYYPEGLALDHKGNLYIADGGNQVIRKVDTSGIITTFAGTHTGGYNGDNIPATSADLYKPGGMFVDSIGELIFTDILNERVRKIDTLGIITTIAGNGSASYGGDGGPAIYASINFVHSIGIDKQGNLLIADHGNLRLRRVDKTTGIITTIAGNGGSGSFGDGGQATLANLDAAGVAVDADGNIFIADFNNNNVRVVTTDNIIHTYTGNGNPAYSGDGGPASAAEVYNPLGLFEDSLNNLFICDRENNRIRKISGSALPVSLLNFTATLKGSDALVQWQTADEQNTESFTVERSTDAVHFAQVQQLQAARNSTGILNYAYTDANVTSLGADKLYYRLKETFTSGLINYTKIIPLSLVDKQPELTVWPNPVSSQINLRLNYYTGNANISVFDAAGNKVKELTQGVYGSNSMTINTTDLAKGTYFVNVVIDDSIIKQKIVKE